MKTPIQIRFADIDSMGIVHNAAYLHYFEQSRLMFFLNGLGKDWNWNKESFVIARNEIDYLKPLKLENQPFVKIKIEKVHLKSFELSYEVITENNIDKTIHATGISIAVCINISENKSIEIPKKLKEFLLKNLSQKQL